MLLFFSISQKKIRRNWELFSREMIFYAWYYIWVYRKKRQPVVMPDRKVPRYLNNFALFPLLATTSWYKNDEMVDMSYTTSGRESRNMYTFVASSEDNGARFRCEAKNEQIVQPMKTEILLKVQCRLFFVFFNRM